ARSCRRRPPARASRTGRDLLRERLARDRDARRPPRGATQGPGRRRGRGHGQHLSLRRHLSAADDDRPRCGRARAHRRRAAAEAHRAPEPEAEDLRRRAAPCRPSDVRSVGVTTMPEPRRLPFLGPRRRAGIGLSGTEAVVLLIPALLPVLVLSVAPLARGIYLGFTDSQAGLGIPTHFIGIDNFRALIHDDLFVNSFKIGLVWAACVTAIQFCLALGLALLLSQPLHGRWLARALALVPWAMPSVLVGIMGTLFFQPQAGILNEALYRAHLPGSNIDWLSDFTWALPAVILVGVWAGMPQTTVALLAGVQSISDDLHEAAA